LAAQQKILALAKEHNRPVCFDVHIGNNEPKEPDLTGTISFIEALEKLNPGADFKVCIFEENAGNHAIRRALGHAHAINAIERIGDRVPILCAANCLQPYGQNDNDWDQGMVFLTPSQVWGQPPYYVTQMISRNYLPNCVRVEATSPDGALDVTAKRSQDAAVVTLQVVNTEKRPVSATIQLKGFLPKRDSAWVSVLSGALDDVNTPEAPERFVPRESEWKHGCSSEGNFQYTFPAYSFTILRLE
jgi:alpha-L-arabinofuranosidase